MCFGVVQVQMSRHRRGIPPPIAPPVPLTVNPDKQTRRLAPEQDDTVFDSRVHLWLVTAAVYHRLNITRYSADKMVSV